MDRLALEGHVSVVDIAVPVVSDVVDDAARAEERAVDEMPVVVRDTEDN